MSHEGTVDDPRQWPCVAYGSIVVELERGIYDFHTSYPEFGLERYDVILEDNGLRWAAKFMSRANVDEFDGQAVMALLMGVVRAERFSDGTLLAFCEDGSMCRWLKRLRDIEEGYE